MSARTLAGWALVGLLVLAARPDGTRAAEAPRQRLGPLTGLAGSLVWLRAESAWRAGELELAFARAESALAIDPGATSGWTLLAGWHVNRASPAVQDDPGERGAWLAAALAVLERGELVARDPAEIAFAAGVALLTQEAFDEPPTWPGGRPAMRAEAERHLARAAEAGHPVATEFFED